MGDRDRVNSSPSAYEILMHENQRLEKELKIEKETKTKSDKVHKEEIERINKHHKVVMKDFQTKIERLENIVAQAEPPPKESTKERNHTDSDESDIFEGLSEEK